MSKTTLGIFCLFFSLLVADGNTFASQSAGKPSGSPAPYTFAVIPFYTPEKIWALYSPFIVYLNKTTGVTWELRLYNNHDDLIEGICNGKVSAALLGPVPLGRANNKCGAKPSLVAIGQDGKASYHSVIMTNTRSVKSLKDLKGKKIGFFKGSTAAHILPARMLKEAGVDMDAILPVFLESQDRIISALLSGEVAAAGVKESLANKFTGQKLAVVAVSPPLPNFALWVTPSLPSAVRQRMVSSLIRLKPLANGTDAETMKSWDDEIKNGFITPNKEFLPSVIKIFEIFSDIQRSPK